jgi:L,D-transpeptidase catalytic domain
VPTTQHSSIRSGSWLRRKYMLGHLPGHRIGPVQTCARTKPPPQSRCLYPLRGRVRHGTCEHHTRASTIAASTAAESHGCVRLATPSIDWLAQRIGPGVPVTIYHQKARHERCNVQQLRGPMNRRQPSDASRPRSPRRAAQREHDARTEGPRGQPCTEPSGSSIDRALGGSSCATAIDGDPKHARVGWDVESGQIS